MAETWLSNLFLILFAIPILFAPANSTAAALVGQIKLSEPIPKQKAIRVSRDHDYCGQTLPNEGYLIGPARGLKNVIVYLEGFPDNPIPPTEVKTNFLENRHCLFDPHIMVMRWGERLVLRNNDPKLHILHAYLAKRTVFNIALPFQYTTFATTYKIKSPGLLQVNCDVHAWMRAYVHVFGHPYYALTDERGFFSIPDVPPGRYTLKAWHERGGLQRAEVGVPEEGEIEVHLEFSDNGEP